MARRSRQRRAVSISDLAEMGFCERKAYLKATVGDVDTPESARRRRAGASHHQEFDRQVQRHHNTPRSRDSRCFIATAVYGLNDVRTEELRRFRDESLAASKVGRVVISVYYAVSPGFARWLDRSPRLRAVVSRILDQVRKGIQQYREGRGS